MKDLKIFLIGPVLARPNKPQFDDVAKELRSRGYSIVNPFDIYEADSKPLSREQFLRECCKMMLDCNTVVIIGDIIPDRDASIQRNLAASVGIPERRIETLKNLTDAAAATN